MLGLGKEVLRAEPCQWCLGFRPGDYHCLGTSWNLAVLDEQSWDFTEAKTEVSVV